MAHGAMQRGGTTALTQLLKRHARCGAGDATQPAHSRRQDTDAQHHASLQQHYPQNHSVTNDTHSTMPQSQGSLAYLLLHVTQNTRSQGIYMLDAAPESTAHKHKPSSSTPGANSAARQTRCCLVSIAEARRDAFRSQSPSLSHCPPTAR